MPKTLAVLLLAPLLALFLVSSALAHARYDHSTPSPGQVLAVPPTRIDIYTAQDMRKVTGQNVITVIGPSGAEVDTGGTTIDDANRKHFFIGLKPNLPPGRYLVNFKTWSDLDGEHDHGSFAFYIGMGPTPAQKAQDAKLALTTDVAPPPSSSSSHKSAIIIIAAAAVIVVAIAATGVSIMARRRRRA